MARCSSFFNSYIIVPPAPPFELLNLYNALGGSTLNFPRYVSITLDSTPYRLTYTSGNAGGSGPGPGNEGWTVGGGVTGWDVPEIFNYGENNWYIYVPTYNWYNSSNTIIGSDGSAGFILSGYTFLPSL